MKTVILATCLAMTASAALAAGHAMAPMIEAEDQSVAGGTVSADTVVAGENGWLVVHRTDAEMAPGVVVGHAPLREGENLDVAAILTEPVAPGDMLMLMVHAEDGGVATGIFEYTLGAKEDGPVRVDGELVMNVITAQ
ncbi:DUF7282 domain-containing protein [Limimaricola pyoseonensis]|uniref:DUF7282 domain-containing protein n=1 Tax=Limimaricola pyoseonensis TaxID=521013 RepID=A0A1G7JK93_9RHOB|nr:hypothetical protein [Limimaricola pyoseonensis]SDF25306.1 hypothetical protein SAMN04488567_3757 [Limimaricola pyoseonensis]